MKLIRQAMWAFLCAAVLAGPAVAQMKPKTQTQDLVLNEDAKCTTCHDESDKPGVMRIGKTKHGTRADSRTPTCVSCHGKSEQHIADADKGAKNPASTDIVFGKKSKTAAEQQSGACLTCHQGSTRIAWQSSTHATRDVTCSSCHTVHAAHDPVRDKVSQTETCFACHKETRSQVHRPSRHPIAEGKMACADCHNVHGNNPKQMVRPTVNETCYSCHMEKRGPFVHNHQPVAEDCGICHNPHGTVVAGLLKARPPYLCQECHSHSSHPGQTAALPGVRSTSTSIVGSVARGCLNCHTNIHGSNSTVNSATAGRFRR